jgi:DNA-binding LytR/AlgR family response regulator
MKALIVDDEVIFSDYLRAMLLDAAKDIEIVAIENNIPSALQSIERLNHILYF